MATTVNFEHEELQHVGSTFIVTNTLKDLSSGKFFHGAKAVAVGTEEFFATHFVDDPVEFLDVYSNQVVEALDTGSATFEHDGEQFELKMSIQPCESTS